MGKHPTDRKTKAHSVFFSHPDQVLKTDIHFSSSEEGSPSFLVSDVLSSPDWGSDCKFTFK